MLYSVQNAPHGISTTIDGVGFTYSTFDMMVAHLDSMDEDAVFIREDRKESHHSLVNVLFDFEGMTRREMKIIHARSHSRRNAYLECRHCVSEFVEKKVEEKAKRMVPVVSRLSHENCSHGNTKNDRAKCRRMRSRKVS